MGNEFIKKNISTSIVASSGTTIRISDKNGCYEGEEKGKKLFLHTFYPIHTFTTTLINGYPNTDVTKHDGYRFYISRNGLGFEPNTMLISQQNNHQINQSIVSNSKPLESKARITFFTPPNEKKISVSTDKIPKYEHKKIVDNSLMDAKDKLKKGNGGKYLLHETITKGFDENDRYYCNTNYLFLFYNGIDEIAEFQVSISDIKPNNRWEAHFDLTPINNNPYPSISGLRNFSTAASMLRSLENNYCLLNLCLEPSFKIFLNKQNFFLKINDLKSVLSCTPVIINGVTNILVEDYFCITVAVRNKYGQDFVKKFRPIGDAGKIQEFIIDPQTHLINEERSNQAFQITRR